jgi:glutamate-ammonia-ligase adenylyltransferase
VARCGVPRRAADGRPAKWAVLGLGKLGGRELNYQSDLDLVFVYDADGSARAPGGPVANDQFFTELVQRILRALGGSAASGPLYPVDTRLRPHGASGPLVLPLGAFRAYYERTAQAWERLALTRARVVYARGDFGRVVAQAIRAILQLPCDGSALARQVVAMRKKLEETRGATDLKRGCGGLVDIEFLIQYLQLVHAAAAPEILRPNAWEALAALRRAGLLGRRAHAELRVAYDFYRTVESRLRIVDNRSGVELTDHPDGLERLALRLNYGPPHRPTTVESFRADAARHAARVRAWFQQIVAGPAGEVAP